MERVQQGLLAVGALLFLTGMAITLGPATGLLDVPGVGGVAPGEATPEPGDPGGSTPTDSSSPGAEGADGDGDGSGSQPSDGTDRAEEDGSDPSGEDGSTVEVGVNVDDGDQEEEDDGEGDESEVGDEVEEEGEDGDEAEDEDEDGEDKSDRGNGEKRGHDR